MNSSEEETVLVCCATCHVVCKPHMHQVCMSKTDTHYWWNEQIGYLSKLHKHLKYSFWENPFVSPELGQFINEKEFQV